MRNLRVLSSATAFSFHVKGAVSMRFFHFAGPGGGPFTYDTTTTFRALQSSPDPNAALGYTFLTPGAPGVPHVQALANPPLRVSDQAHLAVEDAILTTRQPQDFFADPAMIAGWNQTLTRLGTHFQIFPEPAATVTLTMPGGTQVTLVKVHVANLDVGNAAGELTITENCDVCVTEVTGGFGDLYPVFGRAIYQGSNSAQTTAFFEYFAAISLTGGYPANNDLPGVGAALDGARNTIANQYGDAIWALSQGAPIPHNAGLVNDLQTLAVNQHARPVRLGQGIRAASMGARHAVPPAGQGLDDHAHNRVLQHPANINMAAWGYHWGGVLAVDGGDYITLENYNRAAETDPAAAGGAAQGRLYYFQMYGSLPGQSWHEQWDTVGGPGKAFANALTTVVQPVQQQPMTYYIPGGKDTQATVMAAGTIPALQRALLNGLNYANMHLYAPAPTDRVANKARIQAWRQALAQRLAAPPAFADAPTMALAQHVSAALAQVTAMPI
jgi:hypothetical protein